MSEHRKPSLPGPAHFEAQAEGADPAETTAAGHRIAALLVRGARTVSDQGLVDRVLHLADEEGLSIIAELWSRAPADTIAGALWRLYVLRTWVYRQPLQAAREYAAGKSYAPVHEVLAGVVEPPGPEEVIRLVDTVVRGIVTSDLDITLDRAASFAHIIGVGRGQLSSGDPHSGAKLVDMAHHLHHAAELERRGALH